MTRDEVLKKIEDARNAIKDYKNENLQVAYGSTEQETVQRIRDASVKLIIEAKTIGAAGQQCPACNGSGRV